jgi:hypothetical protein
VIVCSRLWKPAIAGRRGRGREYLSVLMLSKYPLMIAMVVGLSLCSRGLLNSLIGTERKGGIIRLSIRAQSNLMLGTHSITLHLLGVMKFGFIHYGLQKPSGT